MKQNSEHRPVSVLRGLFNVGGRAIVVLEMMIPSMPTRKHTYGASRARFSPKNERVRRANLGNVLFVLLREVRRNLDEQRWVSPRLQLVRDHARHPAENSAF
jgi:hypothetical protein